MIQIRGAPPDAVLERVPDAGSDAAADAQTRVAASAVPDPDASVNARRDDVSDSDSETGRRRRVPRGRGSHGGADGVCLA